MNVAIRTAKDWRDGKYSMPGKSFKALLRIAGLKKDDLSHQALPNFWHINDAARKGAYRRAELYGNFGTAEGRRLGGIRSMATHIKNKNSSFRVLKFIKKPKHSLLLAEFIGIVFGDGHLSEYQTSITTNSKTDKEHAIFIQKLIQRLFAVSATVKEKTNENTVSIVASSRTLVKFLHSLGMPIGNKLENHITIPKWIIKNSIFQKSFLRGLFDTDGCIYLDKHKTKKKTYYHMGWTITSYAGTLRQGIVQSLHNFDFSPTHQPTQTSIFLRKQSEIHRYFKEIGTSNPKHFKRYKEFTQKMNR